MITLPVTTDILSVRAVKTSCASLSRLYRPSVGAITHCLFRCRLVHTANLLGGSVNTCEIWSALSHQIVRGVRIPNQ